MQFKPYCATCGKVRPDDQTSTWCIPCRNTGHNYRLVADDDDRQQRIARWDAHHKQFDYTEAQIANIPSFQRLLHVPAEAIIN